MNLNNKSSVKTHRLNFAFALSLTILICNFQQPAIGAPVPGLGETSLVKMERDIFHYKDLFSISAENTNWTINKPNSSRKYTVTEFRAPEISNGVQAALTVRVDSLDKKISLKRYMKKSLTDYPRLGFTLLNQRALKLKGEWAYLVDVFNPETQRQLRQIVFLKNQSAVILTCRSHKKSFSQYSEACNHIIKNFEWGPL